MCKLLVYLYDMEFMHALKKLTCSQLFISWQKNDEEKNEKHKPTSAEGALLVLVCDQIAMRPGTYPLS